MSATDGLIDQFHDRADCKHFLVDVRFEGLAHGLTINVAIEKRLNKVNTSREDGSKPTKDLIEQLDQTSIDLRDLSKTQNQAASSLPAHSQKTITEVWTQS